MPRALAANLTLHQGSVLHLHSPWLLGTQVAKPQGPAKKAKTSGRPSEPGEELLPCPSTLTSQCWLWTPRTLSLPEPWPWLCKSCGSLHHPHSTSLGQVSISPKPASFPWGIFTSWPQPAERSWGNVAPCPRKYPVLHFLVTGHAKIKTFSST